MKSIRWQIMLACCLVGASILFYIVHFLLFHDAHHIFIYLVGDIAFVPIEVLLVTVILHQLLSYKEKQSKLKKLNMVIGVFFSEVGTELLRSFIAFDATVDRIRTHLIVEPSWKDKEFDTSAKILTAYNFDIDIHKGELEKLRTALIEKRTFMLGLLENPNLLEHESFTDLLWAVFHLTEELSERTSVTQLPERDYQHLAGDIKRAYAVLLVEWLAYMKHLKQQYPYLFSLAIRMNPFDTKAKVIVS